MGVRELWLIDPEAKEVEVRFFEAGHSQLYKVGDVLRSEVLPKIDSCQRAFLVAGDRASETSIRA